VKINIYKNSKGREPFNDWLNSLDTQIKFRIRHRIDRIEEFRFFGDYKRLDEQLYELRFHFGAGYRVYFLYLKPEEIFILCGGDKSSQKHDIKKAKEYMEASQND